MSPTSFRAWLKTRRHDPNPIGDLARDALTDSTWPRGPGSLARYREYLESVGACSGALDALETAWEIYERETRG